MCEILNLNNVGARPFLGWLVARVASAASRVVRLSYAPARMKAKTGTLEEPLCRVLVCRAAVMAINVIHFLLLAVPVFLLVSDFYNILLIRPPLPHDIPVPPPKFHGRAGPLDPTSLGGKFRISFCSSCSYKSKALQTRNMLLNLFPGSEVLLTNHRPPLTKRMLSKVVPVGQLAGIVLIVGGDHIFPMLGYVSPPSWYDSLRENRFGAAAGTWIIGNVLQNMLQNTGAFEVYFDGDLIFSKLKENRFPEEFELRELIGKTMELKEVRLT